MGKWDKINQAFDEALENMTKADWDRLKNKFDNKLASQKPKIKRCPFCGSECKIIEATFGDDMTINYRVECLGEEQHSLDSWDEKVENAINIWNKRF